MKPLDPRLIRRAAGVRGLLAVSVLLGLATATAVVAQAVLLAGILGDVIVGGSSLSKVASGVLAVTLVVLARAGLAWATEELARRSAAAVVIGLRRDALVHAAELGPRWRSGAHGGELAVLIGSGLDSLHDYLARYLPQLVLATMVPIALVVYLAVTDLTSGVIVALTLPLIPVFMALIGWYTQRRTTAKLTALTRLAGHFLDVVAGLPTLKVFGRASVQAAAVRRITGNYRRATMGTLKVAFLSSMVLELLASLSVALVAVSIGLRLVSGHLTLQIGLTVLILAPEAYLPLRALGTQFHAAADGVAATGKVLDLLDTPLPMSGARTLAGPLSLQLVDVTIGEPGERGTVGPLTLTVPAGRITVVTGPSGVGKTTLLAVLAGVTRPTAGTVTVITGSSAVDLVDAQMSSWRDKLAWSGQRPVLRSGTIRDNLEAPDADDDEMYRALIACAADDVVDALPDGLNTELGQDGGGLSEGQRQRLCLARAVLKARTAELVLLDEPTSALDTTTELRVLAGLGRALTGRTVVLVSHRSAPLAIADLVVDLQPRHAEAVT
ncbi:thiol reductant ABC exporter CydD subunit [Nakamurella sp. UYEF19]|uniref:thiol reductant ABC exporter subunit CydD n=1 Tax=Nakamurella sp. UYEF19 TaxID=1756392 RepID=UPI003390C7DB